MNKEINKELENIIVEIFPAKDVETIKEMLGMVDNEIEDISKSKRLSHLREIISKRIK